MDLKSDGRDQVLRDWNAQAGNDLHCCCQIDNLPLVLSFCQKMPGIARLFSLCDEMVKEAELLTPLPKAEKWQWQDTRKTSSKTLLALGGTN